MDLNKGKIIGIVTEKTNPQEISEFKKSRLEFEDPISPADVYTNEKIHETIKPTTLSVTVFALVNMILDYLNQGNANICIFEAASLEPSYPTIKYSLANMRYYQDDVYAIVYNNEKEVQKIWNAIRDTESGHCHVGIMTSCSTDMFALEKNRVF